MAPHSGIHLPPSGAALLSPRLFHGPGHQGGNVAISVALCMTLLLGVLAFALDSGFLVTEKNHFQQAVEASALLGAAGLCDLDEAQLIAAVTEAARDNGLSRDAGTLTVEIGFYDEQNHYDDFGVYRDFAATDRMPPGEYANAVRVAYTQSGAGLTGLNPGVTLAAGAVAYLVRIDIAALDPDGQIRLGLGSRWTHTRFFSNGDIRFPESTGGWSAPLFDHCRLLAVGQVLACPVENSGGTSSSSADGSIHWDAGSPRSGDPIRTGLDPLTGIRPVDDDYLDHWRERADKVYRPGDDGQDNIFYAQLTNENNQMTDDSFWLDLGRSGGTSHRVIFFDAAGWDGWAVYVGPHSGTGGQDGHTPNGYSVTNQTLVATCPIHILNYGDTTASGRPRELSVGGEGRDQAVFVSAENIKVWTNTSARVTVEGAVFRTGGDFTMTGGGKDHYLRVVSDGRVGATNSDASAGLLSNGANDSRFGPPCPPVLPRLGRLERVEG